MKAAKLPTLSEAHIQRACTDFLVLDSWRPLRTDPVSDRATINELRQEVGKLGLFPAVLNAVLGAIEKVVRNKGFGEPGMPDMLFMRYLDRPHHVGCIQCGARDGIGCACAELLWCEFKKLGGKSMPHQKQWHFEERARGALVWVLGETFPATIEAFQAHYRASGLMRRRLC